MDARRPKRQREFVVLAMLAGHAPDVRDRDAEGGSVASGNPAMFDEPLGVGQEAQLGENFPDIGGHQREVRAPGCPRRGADA